MRRLSEFMNALNGITDELRDLLDGIEKLPLGPLPTKKVSQNRQFTMRQLFRCMTIGAILFGIWQHQYAIVVLFGFAGLTTIAAGITEAREFNSMARRGMRTKGRVCRTENHKRICHAVVRYFVDDTVFQITEKKGRRDHGRYQLGDTVDLVYLQHAPERARLITEKDALPEDDSKLLIVLGIIWLACATYAWIAIIQLAR